MLIIRRMVQKVQIQVEKTQACSEHQAKNFSMALSDLLVDWKSKTILQRNWTSTAVFSLTPIMTMKMSWRLNCVWPKVLFLDESEESKCNAKPDIYDEKFVLRAASLNDDQCKSYSCP